MNSLTKIDKKLFFRRLIEIGVLILILGICFKLMQNNIKTIEAEKAKVEAYQQEQEALIVNYRLRVDSLSKVNLRLEQEQIRINENLDSLKRVQENINIRYEEEVNTIINASLSEHVKWFYTKIDSLKNINTHLSNN